MLPYYGRYEVACEFKCNTTFRGIYRAVHPEPRETGADVCWLDLRTEARRLPADSPAPGRPCQDAKITLSSQVVCESDIIR